MAYETNTVKIARIVSGTEWILCAAQRTCHSIRTRIRPSLKHILSFWLCVCVCAYRLQMLISSALLTYIIASGFACDWIWTRPHLSKILLPIFRVTDSDKIMVLHILAQFLYKPYILLSVKFRYAVVSLWVANLNPTDLDVRGWTGSNRMWQEWAEWPTQLVTCRFLIEIRGKYYLLNSRCMLYINVPRFVHVCACMCRCTHYTWY